MFMKKPWSTIGISLSGKKRQTFTRVLATVMVVAVAVGLGACQSFPGTNGLSVIVISTPTAGLGQGPVLSGSGPGYSYTGTASVNYTSVDVVQLSPVTQAPASCGFQMWTSGAQVTGLAQTSPPTDPFGFKPDSVGVNLTLPDTGANWSFTVQCGSATDSGSFSSTNNV